jgi:hypothetical protein
MRKILIALATGGALAAAAAPAMAQYAADSMQREENIRDRIASEVRDGDLTYSQATQLRGELRQIERLDASYRDDGMSDWQAQDIDSRLDRLDSRLSYDVSLNNRGGSGFFHHYGLY